MSAEVDTSPEQWTVAERLFSDRSGGFASELVIVALVGAWFPAAIVASPFVVISPTAFMIVLGIAFITVFVYLGLKWTALEQAATSCYIIATSILLWPIAFAYAASSQPAPVSGSSAGVAGLGLIIFAPVALLFASLFGVAGWYLKSKQPNR